MSRLDILHEDDPYDRAWAEEQRDRAWGSPEYQRGPFDYFEPAAYWQQPLESPPAASAGAGRTDSRPETSTDVRTPTALNPAEASPKGHASQRGDGSSDERTAA